ncbi:MAG: tetraacyldisaccharide 4'-kinase [Bacillota bacterium]
MKKKLEEYLLNVIEGRQRGPLARVVLGLLLLLEYIHIIIYKIRSFLYKSGILETKKMNTPVLSVGNITTGGTGKTPLVESLARRLKERDYKVVIISRGYRSKGNKPIIVADEKEIKVDQEKAGDEVFMLASHLPGVPVLCGKDRTMTARLAEKEFNPDIIIADDAFQHWSLGRDLDLVVVDALNPFGHNHLLPRGLLREPLTALSRADIFIVTRSERVDSEELDRLKGRLRSYNKEAEIIFSQHKPFQLGAIACSREEGFYPAKELEEKKILALSGIGSPGSFVRGLNELQAEVVETINYPDHYQYNEEDIMDIAMKAQLNEVEWVVTTEKDAVKFDQDMCSNLRKMEVELYSLDIDLDIDEDRLIKSVFKKLEFE